MRLKWSDLFERLGYSLPDFRIEKKAEAVRLRGTLSYGFKVDSNGAGSFLRLEKARLT